MRLWHKDLIPVLPREQLVAQWRELSAIAGRIQKDGTPNHILVNFVCNYPFDHFITYASLIRREMSSRGYRTMDSVWNKIESLNPSWSIVPYEDLYAQKMNDMYFTICFYNLFEKGLCGGIPDNEMQKIIDLITMKGRESLAEQR